MKPIDFGKILFPVNAAVTAVVFFLLVPTTYVYSSWFPDKKDSLWLVPAAVLLGSAAVWLMTSLNLPKLIEKGIFEDRRKNDRSSAGQTPMNVRRTVWPVLVFIFHMGLLGLMCISLISEMRRGAGENIFFNDRMFWKTP